MEKQILHAEGIQKCCLKCANETAFPSTEYCFFTVTILMCTKLTLYSIITPFDAFEIYNAFENIMENVAFALLGQMLPFP